MAEQQIEESVTVLQPTIRIESDGTPAGTKILSADGVEIKHVQRVDLKMEVGYRNEARLDVYDVSGSIDATLKALHITKLPPPICDLLVEVSAPERHWFRQRSFFQIVRRTNRGEEHALIELVAQGWTSPTAPMQMTVPEYDR